jgi:hypothetical protein
MGCGVSKESAASGVLANTVTKNGTSAAHHPNGNNKGKQANGGATKGERLKKILNGCIKYT